MFLAFFSGDHLALSSSL